MRSRIAQGCGILVLIPCSLFALDPDKTVFQFGSQSWTRQDGLSANGINAITQTPDGFLWVATQMGFARFDGVEFKSFNPPNGAQFRNQMISSLAASRSGGLWFGIRNGSVGFFDERTRFLSFEKEKWNDPAINVISLCEVSDGSVWIGTGKGAARYVPGKTNETHFYEQLFGVTAIYEDSHHRVWLGTDSRGLYYWEAGKIVAFPDETLARMAVVCVVEDSSGRYWVGTTQGLRCYDANFKPIAIPPSYSEVKALLVDRHGVLWVGTTGDGLMRYRDGKFTTFRKTDGLANDSVTALYEDHEGNLWIGTRNGLSQLSDVKLPLYSSNEGFFPGAYHDVFASTNGALWAASSRGISYFQGKEATNLTEAGYSVPYIKRVYESRNGDVYLINGSRDIEVMAHGKIVARYANANWPTSFAEDSEGVVVSVGGDLYRVDRKRMVPYVYKGSNPPGFYWIRNLFSCRDGSILIASVNGIFRLKDGLFQHWTVDNGLADYDVLSICEDSRGDVWAGLTTGLAWLRGSRLYNFNRDSGLYDSFINAVIPDNRGWLWINSSHGIFRVSRQSLEDFVNGTAKQVESIAYDGQESVKTIDTTEVEYTGCRMRDGRVCFPSPQGLILIDPANVGHNGAPPQVHIQRVIANGTDLTDQDGGSARAGKGELEVQYTGISFIAAKKMRFRYRLEGYESEWVDAAHRRSAFYTNLKPGTYRFHVEACNADGIWNASSTSFGVTLPPLFHQTTLFKGLCGLAAVAGLMGAYAWSVRLMRGRQLKLQRANEVLESGIRERTRELAEQRNLLRTLIDHLPDNIFVKDTQSRVVIDNLTHARTLGVDNPDQAVGKTDFDCFPTDVATRFFENEQELLKTGEHYDKEDKVTDLKSGETRWLRTTKVPLRDSDGKIIGLAGIHRDITERKRMEEEVERSHAQLLQVSRQAGMAEVATSVLHNVGNVLNSVNVSASMVSDNLRRSKVASLRQVSELLGNHAGDLARFLTADSRGKKLPFYIDQLATYLGEEQQTMLSEIDLIRKNVEHIKDIVTMQQNYAKVSGITERVKVSELVDDALRMNAGALVRHDVIVNRQYAPDTPEIVVDKHKVLQILVNLIRNAKYACDESGREEKRLTVSVDRQNEHVRVVVTDNGVGIPSENLMRIFNHGFTTRKNGHGFGLHSGALAAREMGGALTVQSDGPGLGATFTLQLPKEFQPPPVNASDRDQPLTVGDR